jgi:hypothetical protein
LIGAFAIVVILALALVFGANKLFSSELTHNCTCTTDDTFKPVSYYNVETKEMNCLCMKPASDQRLTFFEAREACQQSNSSLWAIRDGDEEFRKVFSKLKELNTTQVWIDGRVFGKCPDGGYTCFEGANNFDITILI